MLKDLMKKQFNAELTEGEHKAVLTKWDYIAHKTDADKDYVRMVFTVENCGEKQTYVRNMFERDISIMISHVRRQLGRATETVRPDEFFNELVKDETLFSIWISYPIVTTRRGIQRRQNIYFIAPLAKPATEEAEDMELPEGVGV